MGKGSPLFVGVVQRPPLGKSLYWGSVKCVFSDQEEEDQERPGKDIFALSHKDESFICPHLHQLNKKDEMKYPGIITIIG